MTFLQLVQRLVAECASAQSISSIVSQTGEALRFVNWASQAWTEIQAMHDDWEFLRSSSLLGSGVSFATVSGTSSYPLGSGAGTVGVTAANFGKWIPDSFRNYATTVGTSSEVFMDPIDFDVWRDAYMYGAMRNVRTRPMAVAIGPDKSLCLGPVPNALYTVTGDYYAAPSTMSVDADTPTGLPSRFHMLIVYKAMQYYAAYEAAPEVQARGNDGWSSLITELEAAYGPKIRMAGARA